MRFNGRVLSSVGADNENLFPGRHGYRLVMLLPVVVVLHRPGAVELPRGDTEDSAGTLVGGRFGQQLTVRREL